MKKLRANKRRTFTPKQKKNQLDRLYVSTNIKEELLKALNTKIRGFRDIRWNVKSKKYKTIKDVKYNLLHIILNEYHGHIKSHKSDSNYSTYASVKLREVLGAESDKLMNLVFDKKHPGNNVSLIGDKQTLKYKLKPRVVDICDEVMLGEYKLHARIGRDGDKIITIPDYVVRNVVDGGVVKRNTTKKYHFDNVVQLNEDNMLIMVKMFAELYRARMGKKKVDTDHWDIVLKSVGKDWNEYSLKQIEDRRTKAIELLNKASVDILGEGRLLQVYTEKESGRLFADEWLNIQNIPKEMRYIAMGGVGYYEYDIENAHYNFLYQLNKMFNGSPLDGIGAYIKDTYGVRNSIAKDTGLPYSVVKRILLSMIYGASISQKHTYNDKSHSTDDNSIMKVLLEFVDDNRNMADKLWNNIISNNHIAEIFDNINRAKRAFKKSWVIKKKAGKSYLVNPFQKLIAMEESDGSKKSVNKLMAHMLLGIEASILVFVMEEEQKDFIMPHHDGWVSLIDWKTNTLEGIIRAKTTNMMMDYKGLASGFDIKITKRKINDIEKGSWAEKIIRAKTIKELVKT